MAKTSRSFVSGAVAALCITGCAQQEIIGYYAAWKPDPVVMPGEVTVINFAFASITPDGLLALDGAPTDSSILARLVALKDRDPRLRVMISVGGWTRSNGFSNLAADPAIRARFVESTVAFLRAHRLD